MPFFSAAAMYCATRDRGRAVDRHRRRDVAHVDAVEEHLHIAQRVDRDAALADFAARLRRIGVVAHQRRHIERDRESVLPLLEQESDSARWSAWRCRSRQTGASSTAGRDSRWDGCRACTGTRPARADRAQDRGGGVVRPVDRLERDVGDRAVDRAGARPTAFEPGVDGAGAGRSIILAKLDTLFNSVGTGILPNRAPPRKA